MKSTRFRWRRRESEIPDSARLLAFFAVAASMGACDYRAQSAGDTDALVDAQRSARSDSAADVAPFQPIDRRPRVSHADSVELKVKAADLVIGGADVELVAPHAVVVAADGNIIVFGDDEYRGRAFASDGRALRAFARRGRGPGEVATDLLVHSGSIGDTIWIWDRSNQRIALYTSGGVPLDEIARRNGGGWRDARPEWAGFSPALNPQRLLPGDFALAIPPATSRGGGGGSGRSGGGVPLVRTRWDGTVVDAPMIIPAQPEWFSIDVAPGSARSFVQRFAHLPRHALSPDGRRVVIARVLDGAHPAVDLLHMSTSGDTLARHIVRFTPVRITRAMVDSVIRQIVAPTPASALPPGFPEPAPLAGFDCEIRDSMIVPAFLPPFSEVRLGNDGSAWLRWSAVERNRWLVLSPDGSVECQVMLPERTELRLLDRGAWAFVRDEDGVPSVVRFPTGCG